MQVSGLVMGDRVMNFMDTFLVWSEKAKIRAEIKFYSDVRALAPDFMRNLLICAVVRLDCTFSCFPEGVRAHAQGTGVLNIKLGKAGR